MSDAHLRLRKDMFVQKAQIRNEESRAIALRDRISMKAFLALNFALLSLSLLLLISL